MTPHRLYVGTIGEGLFRSLDGGRTFRRACDGTFVECDVRALVVHPRQPSVLYMGSELGLFRSVDGADNWTLVDGPLAGLQVWSIHVPPLRPETILVGTCPSGLFRSGDGGDTWAVAAATLETACPRILHARVTCVVADPDNPDLAWAGVEIDGVHASRDGGRTWAPVGKGLSSRDVHAIAVVPGPGGRRRLLAATNNDLNVSDDDGETWRPAGIGRVLPWPYCRAWPGRAAGRGWCCSGPATGRREARGWRPARRTPERRGRPPPCRRGPIVPCGVLPSTRRTRS